MKHCRKNLSRGTMATCSLAIVAFAGCGGGVVPVEATLLLDGKPLSGASVSFIRTNGEVGRAAFGMTDDAGKTKLTTFQKYDGALPGTYKVVVAMSQMTSVSPMAAEAGPESSPEQMLMASAPQPQAMRPPRSRLAPLVPDAYSRDSSTPLSVEVKAGMESPVFELATK